MKRIFATLLFVLFLLTSTGVSLAQSATTSLRGVVKDPSGALVPGATVTLTDSSNGTTYHATTNTSGFFIFPVVTPATYLITVDSQGFGELKRTAELLVNQPATIDFALNVKADAVTVDVSASAQTLNFTDATIGNAINNETIQAIPMEGRDPASLLSLQPGVLFFGADTGSADSRQGAVAGGRSDQGNITLDGLDDNDQLSGTAFQGVLRSTMDSTEEFRVTTSNGTAEAGRSSGAQVNLVTKAGTNKFHGSLYEYYRPTNTVANDFFNKNNELVSGESNTPQKYVQNVFGGSVGGPVKKDKLFFFFNYEGLRRAISDVVQATVPTASFMGTGGSSNYNGVLEYKDVNKVVQQISTSQLATLDAPCTGNTFNGNPVCPNGAGADADMLSYLSALPLATGTAAGDGLNSGSFYFTSPKPLTHNTSILKIDYNLNSANKFFVRGNLQKDTQSGDENLPGQPASSYTDDNTKGFAVGHTWTPTSNIVNDIRYGFTRQGYSVSGLGKGDYVYVRFYTQPESQGRTTVQHVPVHNIIDTFNYTRKNHTFSLGGNWRMITNEHGTDANSYSGASTNPFWPDNTDLPDPSTLGASYGAVSSGFFDAYETSYGTLVGTVSSLTTVNQFKVNGPSSGTELADGAFVQRNFRSNEFEYFVQDSWHIRPNLTITAGIRHTLLQTPYETNGQQVSPTIDTDAWFKKRESAAQQGQIYEELLSFAPSGKANKAPAFFPRQKLNIAPRLGVVYGLNSKTSIRAGAGMYYDHYGEGLVNSFDQEGSFGLNSSITNAAGVYGFESSPRFTGEHNLPNYPSCASASTTQSFPYTPPADANCGFAITWGIDNHIKTPYSLSYNFSVQRELSAGFTVEADYVGRFGRHLLVQQDLAEPVNFVDPSGGGDYYTAAHTLSKLVDLNGGNGAVNVPAITYFENVFPFMQNYDYQGESATQAIYTNAWAPYRNGSGETYGLALLDFYGAFPGSPNSGTGNLTPKFWQSQFSSLYAWNSIANSSYNALQVTLRHPTSHGLTVDFSYTYAKSLDLSSGTERANELGSGDNGFSGNAIQNTWNPKLNKAPSDYDTRYLVTLDWVYALPVGRGKKLLGNSSSILDAFVGGWQWSGLTRLTSALPYSFFQAGWATDWQLEGFGIQTAPIKFHKNLANAGLPMIFDLDTQSAVANGVANGTPIRNPYPGEAGQRNAFRGDGYFGIDSSLSKTWKVRDLLAVKFAGEVYNVSNSQRFDDSPASLTTGLASGASLGTYGYTLASNGYRRMQFGLRVDF